VRLPELAAHADLSRWPAGRYNFGFLSDHRLSTGLRSPASRQPEAPGELDRLDREPGEHGNQVPWPGGEERQDDRDGQSHECKLTRALLLERAQARLSPLHLHTEAPPLIAVVVPLKPESHDAVRALLLSGPPFDPEQIPGLERHEVLLAAEEAIFLFDPRLGSDALTDILSNVAAFWRDHVAGPPRLADEVYSWASGADSEDLSFLPTPGPGDSDGGDVF
jgi:hypothetical protein